MSSGGQPVQVLAYCSQSTARKRAVALTRRPSGDPCGIGTSDRGAGGLDLSVDSQASNTCSVSEGRV